FIQAAKQSLDVAIYDLKEHNVLAALKAASTKVHLRIRYDGGTGPKIGSTSTTVDPKSPSAAAIKAASLSKFAESIHDTGHHLMHNKYIIRDGTAVHLARTTRTTSCITRFSLSMTRSSFQAATTSRKTRN